MAPAVSPPAPDGWSLETVLTELQNAGSEHNRAGMKRFGINVERAFGVPMAMTRPLAKRIGKDPDLSDALWASGYHEARILAALIADPKTVTPQQMNAWTAEFNSWDLCDQVCAVFAKTVHAPNRIPAYIADEREFVRRAGFAMIAWRAVHAKKALDTEFLAYLDMIEAKASDPRNFVLKAAHWALRQIGKRSWSLHAPALALAEKLSASSDKAERRVGREALRELTSEKVRTRLDRRAVKDC
jgi:3-methyladenine DNA glycosylase AlkD